VLANIFFHNQKMWFLLFLLICVEALAETSLHKWAKTNKVYFIISGITLYIVVSLLFSYTLKQDKSNLVKINTLWQVGNILLIALIGVFLLKEKLSHKQILGIILALTSTFLMA